MRKLLLSIICAIAVLSTAAEAVAHPIGHGRLALSVQDPIDLNGSARYSYVILQSWDDARARDMKASNPGLKAYVYQDAGMIIDGRATNGFSSTCVNADEAPESWYAHYTSGGRVHPSAWTSLSVADIADPGYRQRCAANARAVVQSGGGVWDGIFWDDVNPTLSGHGIDPASVSELPSDAAYQRAMDGHLAVITPAIRGVARQNLANICCAHDTTTNYDQVARGWWHYLEGVFTEHFSKWDGGPESRMGWVLDKQLAYVRDAQAAGLLALMNSYVRADDRDSARWAYASHLLAYEGRAGSFLSAGSDGRREPWYEEMDYKIGQPKGNYSTLLNGVKARSFDCGKVYVNPTSSSQTVSFGGTYSGSGLSNATSTTLAPSTGLVLYERPTGRRTRQGGCS